MLGSFRSNVTVGIAVLVGIAGLSYVLAASAAPPGGTTAAVEFTPDGKLKRPVGYRNWVYVGEVVTPNDMNDGEATFPEFHSVYMDPESFAEYEKTGKYRDGTVLVKELSSVGIKESAQRQWLLPGRVHRPGGHDQGLEALQGRARQLGLLQLRPQVSAQGGGVQERCRRVQPVPSGQRSRRMIGSSASTTPSCVRRPRVRSEVRQGVSGSVPSRTRPIPHPEETIP